MKRTNTFYLLKILQVRCFAAILVLFAMLLGTMQADAQSSSVTISPTTGSMLAGVAGGYHELGVERGWSSMWQHEQLALTFNVSDYPDLTEGGQLANPAGNMCVFNKQIVIMGGSSADCYWTVSLPKGFRITGYELILLNNLDGLEVNGMTVGTDDVEGGNRVAIKKSFYETSSDFDESNELAHADVMPGFTTGTNNDTKEYVITRESTGDDMGNILYFVIRHDVTGFFAVTIKSFKIYFTAEADFVEKVAPMTPQEVSSEGVSYMNYQFATQKVDVGELSKRTFEETGNTYLVYDYTAVNDLKANIVLFEDDAVSGGVVGENGLKGITATRNGDDYYYALKNNVYYVEAPTNARTQDDKNVNMAYRITGAKIKYNFGQAETEHQYNYQEPREVTTEEGPYDVCVIYGQTRSGRWPNYRYTTYYLTSDGLGQEGGGLPVIWDGSYIRYAGSNGELYLTNTRTVNGGERYVEFTTDKTQAKILTRNGNNFYYTENNTQYDLIFTGNNGFRFANNQANDYNRGTIATASGGQQVTFTHTETVYDDKSVTVPAFTPSDYTIKVFKTTEPTVPKADGTYDDSAYIADKTVEVSKDEPSGEITLSGLNNDAIKFEITGLPAGRQALITVELTMQALNPYISRLDIVCHDPNLVDMPAISKNLTQTFYAEDFAVRGGKFVFYVPQGFDSKTNADGTVTPGQECYFTFENLDHAYGDNTYYGRTSATGHARYYLVNSLYEQSHTSAYSPGVSTATYETKVSVTDSGTRKFKFNNAEDLDHSNTNSNNVYYEEYPFSRAKYTTPAPTGTGGSFAQLTLGNGENEVRYLFTADETRYNIATTTATEHRSYAFYVMDIQLITKTYNPDHEWVKIYDKSCYADDEGKDSELPMYGLKLLTTKNADNEYGYLTTDQITRILNNNDDESYYSEGYVPKNNRPSDVSDLKQVLYIDASELQAVVYRKVTEEGAADDLVLVKNLIGENGLFYLPEGVTYNQDNFAFKTTTGFRTGENIVLTDKKPFFAPYAIQVDGSKYATYTREVTVPINGQVTNATVMLPFTLKLTGGTHTNPDGKCAFTVNTMNDESDLKVQSGSGVNYGAGYFSPVTIDETEANVPYMIQVTNIADELKNGGKISFVATQAGSSIVATEKEGSLGKKEMVGESVTGIFDGDTYYFTNVASYSGNKYDRADSEDIFYFANNKYLNLHTMTSKSRYLYTYPFRGVYKYSTSAPLAKQMRSFDVIYGENPYIGIPTDIDSQKEQADLIVKTGKGEVTISATRSQDVNIHTINGMSTKRVDLNAGDTKTITLPAGAYVVNGVKIIVK